jgi:hypothetical protein
MSLTPSRLGDFMGPSGGGGAVSSSFVGISALTDSTGALPLPTGAAAGDLCLLSGVGTNDITGGSFTVITGDQVSSSAYTCFSWKILTSGDISSPPTITFPDAGGYYCAVYRGPTGVAKKSATNSSADPITISGFTKDASSAFVVCTGHDRDPGAPLLPTFGVHKSGHWKHFVFRPHFF